jgi:hypothetical protein
MAVKAFFAGYLISKNMTSGAVRYPFKKFMVLRQITGRDLGIHTPAHQNDAKNNSDQFYITFSHNL